MFSPVTAYFGDIIRVTYEYEHRRANGFYHSRIAPEWLGDTSFSAVSTIQYEVRYEKHIDQISSLT